MTNAIHLQHIRMHRDGDVAVITLDNPGRRNAFSDPMQRGLSMLIQQVHTTPSIRAVLLTGAGNAFCAGGDLASGIRAGNEKQSRGQLVREAMEALSNPLVAALRELPVPLVTAVPGVAAGSGVGIALAADVVVAAQSAYFYLPHMTRLGIVPDLGTTWYLERLAGRARATALTLLGQRLPAEQALAWGLIWACVDDDQLHGHALGIARQLAELPAHAARETRRAYEAASSNDLPAQLRYEAQRLSVLMDRPEFHEGMSAYIEKRVPDFKRIAGLADAPAAQRDMEA